MSKSSVKVILLHNFQKKGKLGDIISVKPGYARNFLLPRKLVIYANENNISRFESMKVEALRVSSEMREVALATLAKLSSEKNLYVVRNSAQDNKIFGTVSAKDIADAISSRGIAVDRNQIMISSPIKYLGCYKIKFILHPEVTFDKEISVTNSSGGIGISSSDPEDDDIEIEVSDDTLEDIVNIGDNLS